MGTGGTTRQIADNCRSLIQAITPITYWDSSERLHVLVGQPSDNLIPTSATHRSVWLYWVGGTVDISALSLCGSQMHDAEIEIVILYQAPQYAHEAAELASQMAREDTDAIILTLQRLATQPNCTAPNGTTLIGRCLNRRFVPGSDSLAFEEGGLTLTLRFQITYEILSGGY